MTSPLYVGGLDTIAEALRHAATVLAELGHPVLAAKVEADALEIEALYAADLARAADAARAFREDEPTRELPELPSKESP